MKPIERCHHCNAKMITYRHSFNKGLAKGLIVLHKYYQGAAKLNDMKQLNFNQKTNFQKIKFWGLIDKNSNGIWSITQEGLDFVNGKCSIPKLVITFRNETQGFDGEPVTIQECLGDYAYWWREQYLENSL